MALIDDIRKKYPTAANLSDMEIARDLSLKTGQPIHDVAYDLGVTLDIPKSDTGKEFSAGWAGYKGAMETAGAALTGSKTLQNWANANAARADVLRGMSTAPHSWEEMQFGDKEKGVIPYLTQGFAGSAPYLGEAVATALLPQAMIPAKLAEVGLVAPRALGGAALREGMSLAERRAALEGGARSTANNFARGAMVPVTTYPSSLGDVLQNQYQQSGEYDLGYALPAAAGYSALNALGMEGALARRGVTRGLMEPTASRLANAGIGAVRSGTEEAIGETGQEVFNQMARASVDRGYNPWGTEAQAAYKESAIMGGVMGGMFGGVHGVFQKAKTAQDLADKEQVNLTDTTPPKTLASAAQDRVNAGRNLAQLGLSTQDVLAVTPTGDVLTTQEQVDAWNKFGKDLKVLEAAPEVKTPTFTLEQARNKKMIKTFVNNQFTAGNITQEQQTNAINEIDQHTGKMDKLKVNIQTIIAPQEQAATTEQNQQQAETIPVTTNKIGSGGELHLTETTSPVHEGNLTDVQLKQPVGITREATPEAVQQYQAETAAMLSQAVTAKQMEAIKATRGVRNADDSGWEIDQNTGEEMVPMSNAVLGSMNETSRQAVSKNAQTGLKKLYKRAADLGLTPDAADRILGIHGEQAIDVGSISEAQAAQAGLTYRRDQGAPMSNMPESEDLDTTVENYQPEMVQPADVGFEAPVEAAQAQDVELPAEEETAAEEVSKEEPGYEQDFNLSANDYDDAKYVWQKFREEFVGDGIDVPAWEDIPASAFEKFAAAVKYHILTNPQDEKSLLQVRKAQVEATNAREQTTGSNEQVNTGSGKQAEITNAGTSEKPSSTTRRKTRGSKTEQNVRRSEAARIAAVHAKADLLDAQGEVNKLKQSIATYTESANTALAKGKQDVHDTLHEQYITPDKQKLEVAQQKLDEAQQRYDIVRRSETVAVENPSDAATMSAMIKKLFLAPARFANKVSIVDSINQIPADVRAEAQLSENDKTVQGFAWKGKVYLIAPNIEQGEELAVFLHELGAHVGLRKLLGEANYAALAKQISEWASRRDNSMEARVARLAQARMEMAQKSAEERGEEFDDGAMLDELIAYFIEEAVNMGINPLAVNEIESAGLRSWFRRFTTAMKIGLRKIGLGRFESLTAQNIVDMAYGAADLELSGTWHGTAAEFRKFNHDYMGSGEGAQAYGWGTYLAQRKGIANEYFEQDVKRKTKVKKGNLRTWEMLSPQELKEANQIKEAIRRAEDRLNDPALKGAARGMTEDILDRHHKLLDSLLRSKGETPEGSLMRVRPLVSESEMLDWDASLDDQPEAVKAAMEKLPADIVERADEISRHGNATGADLYRAIHEAADEGMFWKEAGVEDTGKREDAQKVASLYLDKLGIHGIKFLDNPSRGTPSKAAELKRRIENFKQTLASLESKSTGETLAGANRRFTPDMQLKALRANIANAEQELAALGDARITRNIVIFNDKNISRTATLQGAKEDKVRFSLKDKAYKAAEAIGGKGAMKVVDDTSHIFTKLHLNFANLSDLIKLAKDVLPSAKVWQQAYLAANATRVKIERTADEVAGMAQKLDKDAYDKVNDFIGVSTFEQKWAYQPTWLEREVVVDPAMAARWAKLSKEEKAIIDAIFKFGEMIINRKKELFKLLNISDKALAMTGKLEGPYAPLKRFGNFIAVLKSQTLLDAEKAAEATPEDKDLAKRVDELKSDPDHYVVSARDTKGQAAQFARENAPYFAFTDSFEAPPNFDDGRSMTYQSLQKVMSAVKADESLPANVRKSMEDMVRSLYLATVEDTSARQMGARRKNRAGYDADMIRAFLAGARADAVFVSNLEHGKDINTAFYKMQSEVKNEQGYREHQDLFNAIAEQYAMNAKHDPSIVGDYAVGLTSTWQLSTSISYHVQNATQAIMKTVPKLGADFNDYQGAWKYMIDGYKILAEGMNGASFDISKVRNLGLRDALQHAANQQILDVGIEEDLAHLNRTRTGYTGVDVTTKVVSSVVHKLRQIARMVELWNRVSSAAAAYNMAIAKGKSIAEAQEYVDDVLRATQGDMSRRDAPLILKKLPRATVQYKKYQFLVAGMYIRAFNQAFNSSSAKEKAIGRRMLSYMLFHTSVSAGVLAWPMMNFAAMVYGYLMGDDDEPADMEQDVRDALGDGVLADVMTKGVFSMVGLDMKAKLDESKVFSILPYGDIDFTSAKGAMNTMAQLVGGPAAGQIGRIADGIGLVHDGYLYKGIERMMPKGVEDAMKAFRLTNEGFTMRNGDVIVGPEDLSGVALALQAIGMPTTEIREIQRKRSLQYNLVQFYADRTKQIEHEYERAYRENDTERMDELRDEWTGLQEGKDRARMYFNDSKDMLRRQPLSNLLKYPHNVEKRELKEQAAIMTKD